MNKNEFCEELKTNKIWSDEFEKDYMNFIKYQKIIVECLQDFHRVCEKNKIQYELTWGSLLGAIRDNGIIPWDYDVDVFVPFEQREALIEALNNDLNKKYYSYCIENYKECRHVYMRIAPKGYNSEVFHLDVFFLVGVPDNVDEELFAKRIALISNIHSDKLMKPCVNTRHPMLIIERLIKKLKYLNYKIRKLREEYYFLCKKESIFKANKCIHGDGFAADYEFSRDLLYPTILYQTEMGVFRIPKNYEKVLKLMYGDYLTVPPLNNRVEEMKTHIHRLSKWSLK